MSVSNGVAVENTCLSHRGFTLVEIIITLVLMGIMASMFTTLFTNSFTESSKPVKILQQDVDLVSVMEQLIANWSNIGSTIEQSNLVTFSATIGAEGAVHSLNSKEYFVIDNHFVSYDSSGVETESASTTDYLKVTIRPNSDLNKQSLTYLFTVR